MVGVELRVDNGAGEIARGSKHHARDSGIQLRINACGFIPCVKWAGGKILAMVETKTFRSGRIIRG